MAPNKAKAKPALDRNTLLRIGRQIRMDRPVDENEELPPLMVGLLQEIRVRHG